MAVDLAEIPRTCTKCNQTKPVSEFHRFTDKRRGTGGYRWQCKACASLSACDWAARNKSRRNETQLRNYHRRKSDRSYMEKRRTRSREYMRKQWSTPEAVRAAKARYQRARQNNVVPYLIRAARARAKQKGLAFNLTKEWALARWTGRCELTGIEFRQQVGQQGPRSPSIDRIDASIGYVQSNSRFVLSAVNSFKGSASDAEMYEIAAALIAARHS